MQLHNNFSNFIKCLIILTILTEIRGEYYSSVVGLQKLLDMEEHFITVFDYYISEVDKVHEEIESFLNKTEMERKDLNNNPDDFFLKPMNIFKIIKRIAVDWKYYDEIIAMTTEYKELNETISLLESTYTKASAKDLQGAAEGLSRLQDVYQLETKDLADGYILDNKYSENLKAHDSYILGVNLYNSKMFSRASEWLSQAMLQLDNSLHKDEGDAVEEFPFISYVGILEYLPSALYSSNNFKMAELWNQLLLDLSPENPFGLANKELFKQAAIKDRRSRRSSNQEKKSELTTLHAQVCSGKLKQTAAVLRPLRCRYVTNNVPFYFIGPFKMEELNQDPFMVFYHQTIYDGEIKQILQNVDNKVERSKAGYIGVTEIRTSQQTWLDWDKHDFMKKIYQRLEDITGLSLATGEPLQVANYGIGGHYGPHYDFADDPKKFFGKDENRILTAMFYISDVKLGGATAFPFLHLALTPIKYSLVVWYNLHESTEPDYRTKHAGCPVIIGSKWICNEWFKDVGQELKRPCGLETVGDKYKDLNFVQ